MLPARSRARFRLDLSDERLWDGNQVIPLPRKPFLMLRYFVERPNHLLTNEAILEHVWPNTWVTKGSIKDYVQVIRRALRDDPRQPQFIETVRGRGYRYLGGIEVLSTATKHCFRESGHASPPAVAILPFDNMSGDPKDECLANGMTEDIKIALSRFHSLRVTACSYSNARSGQSFNARNIGRQLGVHYLIAGSVRKADQRVRFTVCLLEAATGIHLWAERYDRELTDVILFQNTIAQAVASIVAERLRTRAQDRAARKLTEKLNAYDYVLRGQGIIANAKENNRRARQAFEKAVELDPACCRAYAGLAHSHVIDGIFGYEASPERSLDQALTFASKAVLLDTADSKAERILGHALNKRGEFKHAQTHFDRALELNPIDADAYVMKGMCLADAGELEESIDCYKTAMRLNRYYPGWYVWNLGYAYFAAQRYDQALIPLITFTDRYPRFMRPRRDLAATYAQLGQIEEAQGVVEEILTCEPDASLRQEHALLFWRFNEQELEHLLGSLRRAGLPE